MAARSASIAGFVLLLLLVPVPSSSASHVKLDLHGTVHIGGEIYATMKFGMPPREYNLHMDTGSVITWLQCVVPQPSYCKPQCITWPQPHPFYNLIPEKMVKSTDPICVDLAGHPKVPICPYQIQYGAGETSQGYLVWDELALRSNARHTVAFGCGYNQQGVSEGSSSVDGVLALGRGRSSVSLISQLQQQGVITKNVFSHCFRAERDGGFLFIGENVHSSLGITWVYIDRNAENGHYRLVNAQAALRLQGIEIYNHQMTVVFDSGTTHTYFQREPYEATVNAVKRSLISSSLRKVHDPQGRLCWKGPRAFRSVYDVKNVFKTLSLEFTQQSKTLEIPPENYLIIVNGHVCLAIFPTPDSQLPNIIGAVTMQDRIMIYDNQEHQIGWAHGSCETIESESEITSRL